LAQIIKSGDVFDASDLKLALLFLRETLTAARSAMAILSLFVQITQGNHMARLGAQGLSQPSQVRI
jgi:hypothetical protein